MQVFPIWSQLVHQGQTFRQEGNEVSKFLFLNPAQFSDTVLESQFLSFLMLGTASLKNFLPVSGSAFKFDFVVCLVIVDLAA